MTSQQSNSADSGNREFPFTEAPNATMETEHNSLEAIKGFAGDDPETAVYYPEDDRYLVERDLRTSHYEVVDASPETG